MKKEPPAAALRQKAEAMLKIRSKNAPTASEKTKEIDTLNLIHELEVHQIELELLNEELQLGRQQAELTAKKYTSLYDFAPSGLFTLTMDGNILELNLAGARMLGKERLHLHNSSFGFFVSEHSKPVFNRFLTETFNGAANVHCEVTLTVNGGISVVVNLSGARDESGEHCLVSAIDITERKTAEEKIKASETLFKQVFESSNVGKSITLPSGEINVNQAICNILGYSSDELKNKKWQDITPPDEVPDTQK
jgi:PAS domain S-box-containing protein